MLLIIWSTQMNVPVRPTPALRRKFMIHLKYSCIDCKPAVDEERSSRPLTGGGVSVEHHVGQLDQLDEVPGVTRGRPVRPVGELEVDDHPVLPRHAGALRPPASLGHVQLPHTIIGSLGVNRSTSPANFPPVLLTSALSNSCTLRSPNFLESPTLSGQYLLHLMLVNLSVPSTTLVNITTTRTLYCQIISQNAGVVSWPGPWGGQNFRH